MSQPFFLTKEVQVELSLITCSCLAEVCASFFTVDCKEHTYKKILRKSYIIQENVNPIKGKLV